MEKLQQIRGTHDLLPQDWARHHYIAETARRMAEWHGFAAMATPMIEFRDVFVRAVGEATDIVSKEMFRVTPPSTEDGGHEREAMVLRPENTAAIIRAVMNGGLTEQMPQRLFYYGPMFRYERPQKGRLRQFHQIGAETLGVFSPMADIELISLAAGILREILPDGGRGQFRLLLNSLGDSESRANYRDALVEHFGGGKFALSETSRERLLKNPLRILDSKSPEDQLAIQTAPQLINFLNEPSRAFFARVQDGLSALGIDPMVESKLVRGLDYYSHTVFEFVTDKLGAQGTLLAGGRYDGLMAAMGGPALPGIGWAAGVERLAELIDSAKIPTPRPPILLICFGSDAVENRGMALANELREKGFVVEMAMQQPDHKRLQKALQHANRVGTEFSLIMGPDEFLSDMIEVKNMANRESHKIAVAELPSFLAKMP
ncbi:MAG: histidine--tRNA ligase [Candidatus Symbiobacter sp.]|nr:histidine--tRNA ligase [Candidatus Symbiobacter sp.]